jgi:hypothetical protein
MADAGSQEGVAADQKGGHMIERSMSKWSNLRFVDDLLVHVFDPLMLKMTTSYALRAHSSAKAEQDPWYAPPRRYIG